jgi:hypothetical protein
MYWKGGLLVNMTIYLDAEEYAFVKAKGSGYVRREVREAMKAEQEFCDAKARRASTEDMTARTGLRAAPGGIHCPMCSEPLAFIGQAHRCKGEA